MAETNLQLPEIDERTIDPDALRSRYREERDRRLRADGNEQYVEIKGELGRLLDDPWAEPGFTRAPITRTMDVLIVGGGFGGLLAGARLRAIGCEDLCIIDRATDFGGTWYWNRYPGAACDTESYIYLPLLEETGYMPRAKYARAPEILEHSRRIGRHFGLYSSALFRTTITEMRWLDDERRWFIGTDRGDQLRARFVVLAGGGLNRAKLPGIPGLGSFEGHAFHTSRWDYAYTGGDPNGGHLAGLADKRVGIIGTGATAVQCVPHLGAAAKELLVFQRTPSSVDVRNDRPTDPAWAASLESGWQRERMDNFTAVISGAPFDVDLVKDGWTDLIGNILLVARGKSGDGKRVENEAELIQLADYQKMERVRARVDAVVRHRATADALKPWYDQFCKRPCFHDDYLDTFNRPNVRLINTEGRGVERITPKGVVAGGREHELDCLIFGTGFEVGTDFTRRLRFEIHGRQGLTLTEKWKPGASTLHGFFTRGFPNLFVMTTQQSGQSANFQHMLDVQSRHLAYIMGEMRTRGVAAVEPSEAAEQAWVETILRYARRRQSFLDECTPGYYNNEGQPNERTMLNAQYRRGPVAFIRIIDAWREDGGLPGLELTPDS